MGLFDKVKNFFSKTIAQPAQKLFTKTVAPAVSNFFSKGGSGESILGGISKGLGDVSNVASKVLNNPITKGAISFIAPELAVPLMTGSALLNTGKRLTDINTYKGGAGNAGKNVLEIARQAPLRTLSFA